LLPAFDIATRKENPIMTQAYVTKKTHYGTDRYYPDCSVTRTICAIAESKTLSPEVMRHAQKLNISIALRAEALPI